MSVPQTDVLTTSPHSPLALQYFIVTGVAGIEPTSVVLETAVLPLNYTPSDGGRRIWTYEPEGTDLQSAAFGHFAIPPWIAMAQDRVELPTHGASIRCSTNWATAPIERPWPDLNRRSPPWQGGVLTATLQGQTGIAGEGFEPTTSGLWARRATNCSTPR